MSQLYYVERQGLAIVLGVVAMAVVLAIDYRRIRDMWVLVYLAVLPLLIGVLVIGSRHKGAQAWFQVGPLQFQPSEITKVVVVIAVAGYCHQHRNDLDTGRLAVAIALAGFVMALVFLQHDLGTTLVILVCSFSVLVVAGLRPVHIGVLVLIGVTLVGAAVVTGKVAAYRVDRIVGFLDQSNDQPAGVEADAGASTASTSRRSRSSTAASSGEGLFKGRQTNLSYVPEQHTDFIFTVVGEELGLPRRRHADRSLRAARVARVANRAVVVRLLRHAARGRCARDLRVPGVREHRHDDGHHADHRYPVAVHVVRRLGDHRVVHRDRPRRQREHAPLQLASSRFPLRAARGTP